MFDRDEQEISRFIAEGLDAVLSGKATLDQVLAAHPSQAAAIKPSLEAGLWLGERRAQVSARPGFVAPNEHAARAPPASAGGLLEGDSNEVMGAPGNVKKTHSVWAPPSKTPSRPKVREKRLGRRPKPRGGRERALRASPRAVRFS